MQSFFLIYSNIQIFSSILKTFEYLHAQVGEKKKSEIILNLYCLKLGVSTVYINFLHPFNASDKNDCLYQKTALDGKTSLYTR